MPQNREKIKEIVTGELNDKIDNLKLAIDIAEKRDENFLTVKLAFTTFIGVVFTIVFANQTSFSQNFRITLTIITFCTFLLLIYEFWSSFSEVEKALEKQNRRVILAHLRHIAALQNPPKAEFDTYAQEAERFLVGEDKLKNFMLKKVSIEEIIKTEKLTNKRWLINFSLWSLLFLSIPFLVWLGLLGII
jgi:hypothetical protein